MRKLGFDNDKYRRLQSEKIRERIDRFGGKLYLEFGGKLFDDFHASRVLPGFEPDSKMRMLLEMKDEAEIVIVISADDMERSKRRGDLGITYDEDTLRLIDAFKGIGLYVGSVSITHYRGQPSADLFRKRLEAMDVRVYMQLWIPDVYQGAPTPVTAFLSVASKVAGFALLSIILAPFAGIPAVQFVIALMAAATLLVGNLGAIPQTNLKRLMGYSSIAQAGFILPLFIGTVKGQLAPNAPFYLAVYLVMTFGAFFALAMIRTQRGSEEISAFRGLGKTNPRLALAITIMFASLAGVPLTAGFFAKMISFVHVINTGLYLNWMLPIMIICAAAGFYYYFKVIRSMYWDKPEEGMEAVQVPVISGVMLAAFSVFIVIGGLMPLFINPIR